jgi:hypothetical protein
MLSWKENIFYFRRKLYSPLEAIMISTRYSIVEAVLIETSICHMGSK